MIVFHIHMNRYIVIFISTSTHMHRYRVIPARRNWLIEAGFETVQHLEFEYPSTLGRLGRFEYPSRLGTLYTYWLFRCISF